jgi:hypothetical protein
MHLVVTIFPLHIARIHLAHLVTFRADLRLRLAVIRPLTVTNDFTFMPLSRLLGLVAVTTQAGSLPNTFFLLAGSIDTGRLDYS